MKNKIEKINDKLKEAKQNSQHRFTLNMLSIALLWITIVVLTGSVLITLYNMNKSICEFNNKVKSVESTQILILLQLQDEEKSVKEVKRIVEKNKTDIDALFIKYGKKYSLDPKLLKSIATVESGLNPNVKTNGGCVGLMQVHPNTGKSVGIDNIYTVEGNIEASAKYLSTLKERYNISEKRMLQIYNGGPSGANSAQALRYANKVQAVKSKL